MTNSAAVAVTYLAPQLSPAEARQAARDERNSIEIVETEALRYAVSAALESMAGWAQPDPIHVAMNDAFMSGTPLDEIALMLTPEVKPTSCQAPFKALLKQLTRNIWYQARRCQQDQHNAVARGGRGVDGIELSVADWAEAQTMAWDDATPSFHDQLEALNTIHNVFSQLFFHAQVAENGTNRPYPLPLFSQQSSPTTWVEAFSFEEAAALMERNEAKKTEDKQAGSAAILSALRRR